MKTRHSILNADARDLSAIPDEAVHLIVTSPPYPMIEMWDETFAGLNGDVKRALDAGEGDVAFEICHSELDKAWRHCVRALRPGGFLCINIGDATRTIASEFRLYSNHSRVITALTRLGMSALPDILWRKPTNAPNKFMGSGMLPAGAYVTYEHEYILIFRKGGPRTFATPALKLARRQSAFFWEERNLWFSDVWTDLKGTSQALTDQASRTRSGAFPFELAYRLVNMYSVRGDVVLDPFAGTGTTAAAAAAAQRDSISVEIDPTLAPLIARSLGASVSVGRERARRRLTEHRRFVASRLAGEGKLEYENKAHEFPVMTLQERDLQLTWPAALRSECPGRFEMIHADVSDEEAPELENIRGGGLRRMGTS